MSAIDFYEYRKNLTRKLLGLAETLNIDEDPLEYAWIVYGLANMGSDCNLILKYVNILKRWIVSQESKKEKKELPKEYLPVISSYLYGLKRCSLRISQNDVDLALALLGKELSKFTNSPTILQKYSLFNIPEAVFLISIGLSEFISPEIKKNLRDIVVSLGKYGSSKRKVLYYASDFELNPRKTKIPLEIKECVNSTESIEDIIALLWFLRRYDQAFLDEQSEKWKLQSILWKRLAKIESLLEELLSNSGIILSLLYETVLYETELPNPHVVFDNYPLHPEVRRIAEGLYKKGEYLSAVFEASKLLEDHIRNQLHVEAYGQRLLDYAFSEKDKKILFVSSVNSISGKNEQEGLELILKGILKAVRNPKGHQPKTKLNIDAYEALDQLVIISYLLKRVERATIIKDK
ncbi:TIGR02391 family protein [Thermococcus sp.]|uniref:TIGR02391 family protein n=1 Tax=Thermococcus sp. TaxID=35749 RepID=UPI000B1C6BB0|nr:TIGR02391 family protein [Thermococcus sp.]MBC7094482.1 TIGR02391 family protein [Thermococcus sp.]